MNPTSLVLEQPLELELELEEEEEEGSESTELSLSKSPELDEALDPLEELSEGSLWCLDLDFFIDFRADRERGLDLVLDLGFSLFIGPGLLLAPLGGSWSSG